MRLALFGAAIVLAIGAAFVLGGGFEEETTGDRVGDAVDKALEDFDAALERVTQD